MALLKLCRCGKAIPMTEKRCEKCENKPKETDRLYDRHIRDTKAKQFYHSREWIRTREQALIRDNYLCQHCLQNKRINKAQMVHHIIEVKVDWSKRLELGNLISLCNSCHNKIEHQPRGRG